LKIIDALIERYCAIESVELKFGDLTILVGKNGSGKTSILDSLYRFFYEFNGTAGGVPAGFSDYYWYKRRTDKPITFKLKLELSDAEYRSVFTLPEDVLKVVESQQADKVRTLEVSRSIVNLQQGWRTDVIKWGKVTLVKDDQIIGQDELVGILASPQAMSNYLLVFFSNQKYQGDRLLVDQEKKVAYHSSPQIDAIASRGLIKTITQPGQDYRQWCQNNGFALNERAPQQQEIGFPIQPISQQQIQSIINQLTNFLRGRLRLVPAARDNRQTSGQRVPIIDQAAIDAQRNLLISTVLSDEEKKNKLSEWVKDIMQKEIHPNPAQVLIKDSELYLPVQFLGGGEQELLYVIWNMLDEGFIYVIEEPENHFHPEYCRKFLKFLKETLSKKSQVILSTHSPHFVDKSVVTNNWLVKRTNSKSQVEQIGDRDHLKLILAELGLVPSDLFLKDFAIFVEGGTEREAIIPIFAEKLGLENITDRVMIKAVGGNRQFKNYLKIWLDLIEYAPIEYRILMDKSSEVNPYDLIRLVQKPDLILTLNKESIEGYYPIEHVKSALKDLFNIQDAEIDSKKRIDHQVEELLNRNKKSRPGWKVELGQYVARRMSADQIPEEIKQLLEQAKRVIYEK
jgi:predicted ATPase